MKKINLLLLAMAVTGVTAGCTKTEVTQEDTSGIFRLGVGGGTQVDSSAANFNQETNTLITPGTEISRLEDGFYAVRYDGDYWFDNYLKQGGASSDEEVIEFLTGQLQLGEANPIFLTRGFGCSTLAVTNQEGEALFGRNFDWRSCEALVVKTNPSDQADQYASISTVNMDFIGSGYGLGFEQLPDKILALIALYAPLDGMNENGLAVSVNMIQDSASISQDTGRPDLTTTTAIRLLLDKAADVEEALELLKQYDMHSSMGLMVHFALADKHGRSVVVEYINNEMIVTDTPAVTNFYHAPGEKQGIGTSQSHTRYEILMKCLSEDPVMSVGQLKDSLSSVSKEKFQETAKQANSSGTQSMDHFESTEWSIVFHLNRGEAYYYHRENYDNSYQFNINK